MISREAYRTLKEMLKYRNAIVHGFSLSDFRVEMVVGLLNTGRRIITPTLETKDDDRQTSSSVE